MSSAKMIAVANKLLERSRKGEVAWSDSRVIDNRLSVDYPDYSVSISVTRSGDYELSVLNHLGTAVESLHAPKKSEQDPRHSGEPIRIPDYYRTLRDLYEEAKRTALKPEKVLDDLLDRLGGED